MVVSKQRLEMECRDFLILKRKICDEMNIEKSLSDDEIEELLKQLLSIESELFDNCMIDLFLRNYYDSFLKHVYPPIEELVEENSDSKSLKQYYFTEKHDINHLNESAIYKALGKYFYRIKDGYLLNCLNSHEVLIPENVKNEILKKDLFCVQQQCDNGRAKHQPVEFNYDINYWKAYEKYVEKQLEEINERLCEKLDNFSEDLEIYENHLFLYKKFIIKSRYLEMIMNSEQNVK